MGYVIFFEAHPLYECIADDLDFPTNKHLFPVAHMANSKGELLSAIQNRVSYMKKHLAEWQEKIIVKQEASLF